MSDQNSAQGDDTAQTTPVVLVIRDGWGENPNPEHREWDAVALAETPVADRLAKAWPRTLIATCCEDVGLPNGTMGNSEVGHQNIGAGRVVDQEIMRISRTIREGTFFDNPALIGAFEHAREQRSKVHLIGLASDGQVHSDLEHLFALIDLASQQRIQRDRLCVHAFMDGRDTGPKSGLGFIEKIEEHLQAAGVGRIASVCGRYYAMDRDHRWARVARAYACLTGRDAQHEALPEGPMVRSASSATSAVKNYYENPSEASRSGDEFVEPTRIVDDEGTPLGLIEDGDAVIFFNFRGDRPREITKAFMLEDDGWREIKNGGFERGARLETLYFCAMTRYETGLPVTAIAFDKPPKMPNILGQMVSDAGLTQFRCAETEKYPHVTFFFNDYRDDPFPGEVRQLLPSPQDVSTYDQKPEMSAHAVRDAVLERLAASDCEALIVVNFANPDMVGHTGKKEAVVRAVEVVDACVGALVEATLKRGGSLIITADHGNAEQTWDPENDCPHTAHTTFTVPLIAVGDAVTGNTLRDDGRLADIAPTILAMMGLEPPEDMTGRSLLEPV